MDRCDTCDSRYCLPGQCRADDPSYAYVAGFGWIHINRVSELMRGVMAKFPTGRLIMTVDWPQSPVWTAIRANGRRGWSPTRETYVLREA